MFGRESRNVKKVIITGVIFSTILLVRCNEKTEVVELAASKNGGNVESLESKSNVLSELQNEIIDSITEQTKNDRESITISIWHVYNPTLQLAFKLSRNLNTPLESLFLY